VPDPLQTLEPVASPAGPALKNEMMLPAVLDPWASHAQSSAGTLNLELGGLTPASQHDRLVVAGPVTLDGAWQVSFTNGFVAGSGDCLNVRSYASRSGGFASSSAGAFGLTESCTPASLVLIAGSNAFHSLTFTVAGGNTQTVCVPFQLRATAADVDGAVGHQPGGATGRRGHRQRQRRAAVTHGGVGLSGRIHVHRARGWKRGRHFVADAGGGATAADWGAIAGGQRVPPVFVFNEV